VDEVSWLELPEDSFDEVFIGFDMVRDPVLGGHGAEEFAIVELVPFFAEEFDRCNLLRCVEGDIRFVD
jgi:hypothetical protein